MVIEVLKPGLETAVQDFPGRKGNLRHGLPPAGPLDDWSFRLANLLVGNPPGAAGLECQFLGPSLLFHQDGLVSVCGGDMAPAVDGIAVAMWSTIRIAAGQVLELGAARRGGRAYIAVAGGIRVPVVMGAMSTYTIARLGGVDGRALQHGDTLEIGPSDSSQWAERRVSPDHRPQFPRDGTWPISVVAGPIIGWISEEGCERFLQSEWRLSPRSNRVGFRLDGPEWLFAEPAYNKAPEHGDHPSNIIDIGYPIGGINLAGDTPIILMLDCITLGGFIVPFTVPSGEFWKLAQAKPNERLRFREVSVAQAQQERRRIESLVNQRALEAAG